MQNNSKIIQRFIEEVLNQGNIESTGQFFWEDMVEQVPLPGQGPGLEGLKGVLRGMRAGFPDMHWSIEEQIAEGDKVVTRFEWTGTHRGEFLGVPATGRPVKVWGRRAKRKKQEELSGEDPEEKARKKKGISNRRFYGNIIPPLTFHGAPRSIAASHCDKTECQPRRIRVQKTEPTGLDLTACQWFANLEIGRAENPAP